nr:MAG TPA: hypothetical protein [Bacteriophage sp.]
MPTIKGLKGGRRNENWNQSCSGVISFKSNTIAIESDNFNLTGNG